MKSTLYPCETHPLTNNTETSDDTSFDTMVEEALHSLPILVNVVNLSNYTLTNPQEEVLNKGLKFCPTPGEPQMGDLQRDLDKFHCSLSLQCHFNKKDESILPKASSGPYSDICSLKLSSKSTWTPLLGQNDSESFP